MGRITSIPIKSQLSRMFTTSNWLVELFSELDSLDRPDDDPHLDRPGDPLHLDRPGLVTLLSSS